MLEKLMQKALHVSIEVLKECTRCLKDWRKEEVDGMGLETWRGTSGLGLESEALKKANGRRRESRCYGFGGENT